MRTSGPDGNEPSGWRKWAWFFGLALAGLLATATLAYSLRALLFMSTG